MALLLQLATHQSVSSCGAELLPTGPYPSFFYFVVVLMQQRLVHGFDVVDGFICGG